MKLRHPWFSIFAVVAAIVVIGAWAWLLWPVQTAPETVTVKLFYYRPDNDLDALGNIQCSAQGLVAVERTMSQDTGLDDVINLLLSGALTADDRAAGLTTDFPLPELRLLESRLGPDSVTLVFDDPRHATSGGACRVTVLWAQIEATAKDFSKVSTVRFEPGDIFQP